MWDKNIVKNRRFEGSLRHMLGLTVLLIMTMTAPVSAVDETMQEIVPEGVISVMDESLVTTEQEMPVEPETWRTDELTDELYEWGPEGTEAAWSLSGESSDDEDADHETADYEAADDAQEFIEEIIEEVVEETTEAEDPAAEPDFMEEIIREEVTEDQDVLGAGTLSISPKTGVPEIILYAGQSFSTRPNDYQLNLAGASLQEIIWEKLKGSTWVADSSGVFTAGKWRCTLTLNGAMSIYDVGSSDAQISFSGLPEGTTWRSYRYTGNGIIYPRSSEFTVAEPESITDINLKGTAPENKIGDPITIPALTLDNDQPYEAMGLKITDIYWSKVEETQKEPPWDEPARRLTSEDTVFLPGYNYYLIVKISLSNPAYALRKSYTACRIDGLSHAGGSYEDTHYSLFGGVRKAGDGSYLFGGRYLVNELGTRDGIRYKVVGNMDERTVCAFGHDSSVIGKDVAFPETVTFNEVTYTLVSIDGAIKHNDTVESVWIPKSVTTIKDAFVGSGKLKSVVFEEGSRLKELGDWAFDDCSALETVTLPPSLERIGMDAFNDCTSLKTIEIPAGVMIIDDKAFEGCKELSLVTFAPGSALEEINYAAFRKCLQLTQITIPASVVRVHDGAFEECKILGTVTFEEGSRLEELHDLAIGEATAGFPVQICCFKDDVQTGAQIRKAVKWVTEDQGWTHVSMKTLSATGKTLSVKSAGGEWVYDAAPHTYQKYEVIYGGEVKTGTEGQTSFVLDNGDAVTVTPAGKGLSGVTNVSDSGENSFTWTVTDEGGYTKGADAPGQLRVTPAPLTIVMADRTVKETGSLQEGWKRTDAGRESVTGLAKSEDVTIAYTPAAAAQAGTYAGAYDVSSLFVSDGGTDVTGNYQIDEARAGRLIIEKDAANLESALIPDVPDVTIGEEGSGAAVGSTAAEQGPALTVTDAGGKILAEGTDYELSWTGLGQVGTASVTITGKGAYSGSVTKSFNILPKGTVIKKLTKGSKRVTVKWKKQAKQTDGYEIQYSTKKDFSKAAKIKKINKAKKTSVVVKKLKAKKTYYMRIRTFKKVNGKKYYSVWSKVKRIKM